MKQPNLLLITTDQQRWDGLGINGNSVLQTPNLDSLASQGVNFSRAYSTCPSCIAARRSILTGFHPTRHGMVGYQDGVEFNPPFTLPGLLREAGYQTQLIGKLHMHPQRKRFGFDHMILSQQADHRPDSPYVGQNDYADWLQEVKPGFVAASHGIGSNSRLTHPFSLEESFHHTHWMVQEAIKFLTQRRDPSMPWFLHLSFPSPHPPFVPPSTYMEHYADHESWKPHLGSWVPSKLNFRKGIAPDSHVGPFTTGEMRQAMAGYYGLIHHLDDQLAYLWNRVFAKKYTAYASEPAWVVFTSDHGEMLGDHYLFRKSLPYEGSAHVPFFVTTHGIPLKPAASSELVCLEDLMPTFLDFAGVDCPKEVDGKSLLPVLKGEKKTIRTHIFGEHLNPFPHQYLVRGPHKYCWFADTNEEQVFDLQKDPYELQDISAEGDLLNSLRSDMEKHLKGRKDYHYQRKRLKPLGNKPPAVFWNPPSKRSDRL